MINKFKLKINNLENVEKFNYLLSNITKFNYLKNKMVKKIY